jgi:FKBP-type peptidyl-prolyl cis-trans isomerase
MIRKILYLLFAAVIVSCNTGYPGYKKGPDGIFYKLNKIGEDTVLIKPGDYVTAELIYKTPADSEFFRGTRKFRVTEPEYRGSIDACLMLLSERDAAEFIIDAGKFFRITLNSAVPTFLQKSGKIKISADVTEVESESEYNKEKEAFLKWIDDFGEYEKIVLKQYLEEEKLTTSPLPSGIYYLPLREGNGKHVERGDTVLLNYEGRFLNGKFFDSTVKRNQPFQLVYGTEWQVVKGLEEAIGLMKEGERSLFIIPSELAFGATGSSTGIIPPYTSVIFEVEILKVSSPGKM